MKFYPPREVANAAHEGLILRHIYKRGGTRVGVARANQLHARRPVSPEVIKRMASFFKRHRKNKNTPPEKGNGKIAWLLWGGDPGEKWVKSIIKMYL